MTEKPSANLIFAVVVFIGVLVFFTTYRFQPDIFPTVEQLPPAG
jgi:flagellar biosynthesis/type III secretory pathway M-ring protein FliF/YscJ